MDKEKFARRVSQILNPMSVLAIVIALVSVKTSGSDIWIAALIAFSFGAIIPLCVVWRMRQRGEIGELFIPERIDRLRPLFLFMASSWLGVGVLHLMHPPPALGALMVCVAVLSALALLITTQWKISLHAVGLWAGCAVVIALYGSSGWWAVLPAGVASWARHMLRVHSVPQILAGGIVGAGVTFLIFNAVLNA